MREPETECLKPIQQRANFRNKPGPLGVEQREHGLDDGVEEGVQLLAPRGGGQATVYLQLMDAAGNVGASGLGMHDSIVMAGTRIYLPVVFRNH
jgi:hypothetical protein